MSSSAVASYLNLLYLITLPSSAEQMQGIQKLADNEKILLKKIFNREVYEYTQPSDSPTQVLPFMFIDHIEQLGQKQQIMTMHCSILFHWIDKRIVWEPKDYGNVNRITRSKSDLPRMWFPAVHFTEMKMRSDQAMQYYNTEVTLMSNGAVYAQVSLTIRSTCSFDFSNYPRDEQSCLLTMFTPLPMSRLKFSRWTALARRSDIFGKDNEGNKLLRSGEFIVTDSVAKPLYILPFGKITTNDTADRPELMRSIVRFEIKFRRSITYYMMSIAIPTFCIGTVSYMAATVKNATTSLIWLLMCIAAQIVNFTQMVDKLPPDHLHAPLCARMATVIFVETFALLLYRIVMSYRYMYYVKSTAQSVLMERIELGMSIALAIHSVANAVIFFI